MNKFKMYEQGIMQMASLCTDMMALGFKIFRNEKVHKAYTYIMFVYLNVMYPVFKLMCIIIDAIFRAKYTACMHWKQSK